MAYARNAMWYFEIGNLPDITKCVLDFPDWLSFSALVFLSLPLLALWVSLSTREEETLNFRSFKLSDMRRVDQGQSAGPRVLRLTQRSS
jgi:hypothetical protein